MAEPELVPVLKRWWWALVLGAALAGIVGYGVAQALPRSYEAQERLLVGSVNTDVGLEASGALARTYAELATSYPVLSNAIERTNVKITPKDLAERVKTSSNEVTRIVTITVTARRPQVAARLASALSARLQALANQRSAEFSSTLDTFAQQSELSALTPDARTAVIAAARRTFGPSSTGRLQVIDRARVPRDPSSPIVPLIVALAALAGVVVAAFVVIGREARRKRRVDERDLFALEPEFLGTVHAPASRNPSRAIPAESRPDSPAAQEYRVLAGRLGLLEPSEEPQNLMLLDSSDGSLAASTALNLAAVLSQAGSTVLLMDANTLGFGVSDLLRLNGRTGYSELVADPDRGAVNGQRAELSVARGSGLYIVPRGVGEAPHFVPAERAARVLDRLSVGADVVILAGPPVMRSPAALVWSRAVERSVLVIDEEEGSAESISQAVNVLTSAHGEFAGTVLARRREPLSPMARRTAERRRVS